MVQVAICRVIDSDTPVFDLRDSIKEKTEPPTTLPIEKIASFPGTQALDARLGWNSKEQVLLLMHRGIYPDTKDKFTVETFRFDREKKKFENLDSIEALMEFNSGAIQKIYFPEFEAKDSDVLSNSGVANCDELRLSVLDSKKMMAFGSNQGYLCIGAEQATPEWRQFVLRVTLDEGGCRVDTIAKYEQLWIGSEVGTDCAGSYELYFIVQFVWIQNRRSSFGCLS